MKKTCAVMFVMSLFLDGCGASVCEDHGGGGSSGSSSSGESSSSTGGLPDGGPGCGDGICKPGEAFTCPQDCGCETSWKSDLYFGIFDGPAGCTAATCHGNSTAPPAGLALVPGQAASARLAFLAASIQTPPGPAVPYVVPGDPGASGLLCNLAVAAGPNPFGTCGHVMPPTGSALPLTDAQLGAVALWVYCGAPAN